MDEESWTQGYLTGVRLHAHLRTPQIFPVPIASMSATGVAADLEWYADLSGVGALTKLSAEYSGAVSASYSYDGRAYTDPVPLGELLRVNPALIFAGVRADAPSLRFRFRLADDAADLQSFTLWGVSSQDLP
ncbi:MAG: hypothetical protein IJK52_00050 [Oscillospiraceae bacterium]|nr:hypothetical protein [Oscillospiraceae bacterium]